MAIKFVLGPLHGLLAFNLKDNNKEGGRVLCQFATRGEHYYTEYEKRSPTHYTWTGNTFLTSWQTVVGGGSI